MAADTHSEYVTPSTFPLQRRLHELATALRPLRVLFVLMTVSAKPPAVFARVLCCTDRHFGFEVSVGAPLSVVYRRVVLHLSHATL